MGILMSKTDAKALAVALRKIDIAGPALVHLGRVPREGLVVTLIEAGDRETIAVIGSVGKPIPADDAFPLSDTEYFRSYFD